MNIFIKLQELKRNLLKIENIFFLTLIFTLFLLDRYSKNLILNYNDSRLFINDFLNIDLIWNTGIGFGFLSSESTVIYNCITLLIGFVILILIYTSINSNKLEKFTFSIILGGALGNFYDRVVFKAVPDFIDLHYNNYHWFTFNVADIFITIGIIIYLLKETFN